MILCNRCTWTLSWIFRDTDWKYSSTDRRHSDLLNHCSRKSTDSEYGHWRNIEFATTDDSILMAALYSFLCRFLTFPVFDSSTLRYVGVNSKGKADRDTNFSRRARIGATPSERV